MGQEWTCVCTTANTMLHDGASMPRCIDAMLSIWPSCREARGMISGWHKLSLSALNKSPYRPDRGGDCMKSSHCRWLL